MHPNAVCLDGSPGSYYYRPAQDGGHDKWVIYFEGGAWCSSGEECVLHILGAPGYELFKGLSSSDYLPEWINVGASPYIQFTEGFLSPFENVNPDFCSWNVVYINYCDGGSYSGTKIDADQVLYNSVTYDVHYKGHFILEAIMDDLLELRAPYEDDFTETTDVVITGCSAGGLATMLHADWIVQTFINATFNITKPPPTFAAIPDSGFFLPIDGIFSSSFPEEQYPVVMKNVYELHGSLVNMDCMNSTAEAYTCIYGPVAWSFLTTPNFIINSLYDSWQVPFILRAGEPFGYSSLLQDTCGMRNSMLNIIREIGTSFEYRGDYNLNGGFLHTCWSHCLSFQEFVYNDTDKYYFMNWNNVVIQETSLRQAVADWYNFTTGIGYFIKPAFPHNNTLVPSESCAGQTVGGDLNPESHYLFNNIQDGQWLIYNNPYTDVLTMGNICLRDAVQFNEEDGLEYEQPTTDNTDNIDNTDNTENTNEVEEETSEDTFEDNSEDTENNNTLRILMSAVLVVISLIQ